jgi:hypothetical protein
VRGDHGKKKKKKKKKKKRRRKKVKKDQGDDLKACKQEATVEGASKEFGAEEEWLTDRRQDSRGKGRRAGRTKKSSDEGRDQQAGERTCHEIATGE